MKLAVDAVVFAYKNANIYVLLIKRKFKPFENFYALPGGFIKDNETAEQAVNRELVEETGLEINYLEQLYTFTRPNRDPRERVVSLSYYGLVNPDKYYITAGNEASSVEWVSIERVMNFPNDLAFDHSEILTYALTRLRNKIKYEPIGFELLPDKFTIGELYKLYATILNEEMDRRNFTKKMNKTKILTPLKEKSKSTTKGRKGVLFKFDQIKYNKLKIKGFDFNFQNI